MLVKKQKRVLPYVVMSILSLVFAAVSWVANFGLLRGLLTLFAVPIFHAVVFVGINVYVSFYAGRSPKLKKLNAIYVLTYLLTNILLPDFGDGAEVYFFFGAFQCGSFFEILLVLAALAFVSHNVICVIQMVMMLNEKIKAKRAARKE